jgi:hypothetical protein
MNRADFSEKTKGPFSGNRAGPNWKVLLVVLLLGHLAITVFLSYKLNIWVDEAYTLNTTGQSLGYALEQSIQFESQAPLYFLTLNIWRKINDSILFARLFSVICILLTLLTFVRLSEYYLPGVNPIYLPAVSAFNPYLIWAAVEMRVFAFGILVTSLLLLVFYRRFMLGRREKQQSLLLAGLFAIAFYTHYFFFFLLAAFLGYLLVIRSWRKLAEYLLLILFPIILALPLLIQLPGHMAGHLSSHQEHIGFLRSLRMVFVLIQDLVIHLTSLPLYGRFVLPTLFLIFIGYIILHFKRKIVSPQVIIWVLFGITAGCFVLFVTLFGPDIINPKYFFIVYILANLAYFSACYFFTEGNRKKFIISSILVMISFHAAILITTYSRLAKSGDYIRVASTLDKMERPGEPILVFNPEAAMALSVHYKGSNSIIPVPNPINFEKFDSALFVIRSEEQLAEVLKKPINSSPYVWLLHAGPDKYLGMDYNYALLENFLFKEYEVESAFSFYRSELRYLRLKRFPN